MDEDTTRERLGAFTNTRRKVRLTRMFPSEPLHNGFILGVGRELVLVQQFHDFYPEGYTALRVRDICEIRSGEYERHWERMLAGEGLMDRIEIPFDMSLDDFPALLCSLQQRGANVVVECEDPEEDIEDFYIGRILSVGPDAVSFANFDGLGRWDEEPDMIAFDEITKVQFETPYVQTFSKYVTEFPNKPASAPVP